MPSDGFTIDHSKPGQPGRPDADVAVDLFSQLQARCRQLGIEVESSSSYGGEILWIDLPNGREKKRLGVGRERITSTLVAGIGEIKVLGTYNALQTSPNSIEAALHSIRFRSSFSRIPGIESPLQTELDRENGEVAVEDIEDEERERGTRRLNRTWRLRYSTPAVSRYSIEIGSASDTFNAFTFSNFLPGVRATTIRIGGLTLDRHDDAVALLEEIGNAALFELSLKYDVSAMLVRARNVGDKFIYRARVDRSAEPPCMPRNSYDSNPLGLYWYAISAQGMPLLQFLAYYQVLEYYFPSYSQRETLNRLRNELRDPRFQPENDAHLSRVLALVRRSGPGYGSERDQLKATIRGCISIDSLSDYMNRSRAWSKEAAAKRAIQGINRPNLDDRKSDIRDQVANRIYDLRCRVVHAKDLGEDRAPELLLPFSREVDHLGPDIDLMRFLAEKVIIGNSSNLTI